MSTEMMLNFTERIVNMEEYFITATHKLMEQVKQLQENYKKTIQMLEKYSKGDDEHDE